VTAVVNLDGSLVVPFLDTGSVAVAAMIGFKGLM
jgi:hypothetical protein